MNWDYIAGILDGEGCIGLYISDYGLLNFKEYAVRIFPAISIASYSPELQTMADFLTNEGVKVMDSKKRIVISEWKSIKILCEKLDGKLYIKKKELDLMKQAVDLYFSLPKVGKGRKISLKRNDFINIAMKLQQFKSKKGRQKPDYTKFLI